MLVKITFTPPKISGRVNCYYLLKRVLGVKEWGGNGPHVDKGTKINKYPQLLLVLSRKLHQFCDGPEAFGI